MSNSPKYGMGSGPSGPEALRDEHMVREAPRADEARRRQRGVCTRRRGAGSGPEAPRGEREAPRADEARRWRRGVCTRGRGTSGREAPRDATRDARMVREAPRADEAGRWGPVTRRGTGAGPEAI